ncbi:TetR/AcrR family transcriptional regulator [Streptomyces mangrovisoli]|uniref:TetR family transcriptional regulator n=1 Tax=Streptomyces mangrovisoli TaxID=1428628 RepID=A0A1J4NVC9_9ACTN|nr:TetR/AcrR family transcriptional regulator [Streptomyces mangrovisoli]OIJ66415.1 TetR family transcriptional regulator [Streptomyces mangrovisoli]
MSDRQGRQVQRRTGGRSARVRRAVLDAALAALAEHGAEKLSIADVAARAEVHETSVYRRWGTREGLIAAAMLAHSEQAQPVPDTGTLRGDLTAYAASTVRMVNSPLGGRLVRAMAAAEDGPELAQLRTEFWRTRAESAGVMIDRAVARGELAAAPDTRLVLDALIAPVHFQLLLTRRPVDEGYAEQVVDLLLTGLRPAEG